MRKYKEQIIWGLISFIIAFILVFVFSKEKIIKPVESINTSVLEQIPCEDIVGEITEDRVIKQQIVFEQDEIETFAVRIATFSAQKDCNLSVIMKDITTGHTVKSWKVNTKGIGDNSFKVFALDDKLTGIKGHIFEITFTSDAKNGNGITLWQNSEQRYLGSLSINELEIDGQLVLGFNLPRSVSRINYMYLFLISLLILIFLFIVVKKKWISKWCQVGKSYAILVKRNYKKLIVYMGIEILVFLLVVLIEVFISQHNLLQPNTAGLVNEFRAAFIFVLISVIIFCVFTRNYLGKEPEKVFLFIGLLIGSLYVYCMPSEIFVSWDEAIHYYRAVSLSRCITGEANLAEAWLAQNNGLRLENSREVIQVLEGQARIQAMYDVGESAAVNAGALKNISIICYIPSALGLCLGRLLRLPYVIIFYMGEIANLLLYFVLAYYAIKKVKSGKMIIVVVTMMTTSVFLAARYSYDTWLNGFYILGISYFIAIMQNKVNCSIRDLVIVWVSFFIGSFAKVIYFPIMACLLLIPQNRFLDHMLCIKFRILIVASMGMLAAGMFVSLFYLPAIFLCIYIMGYWGYKVIVKMNKAQKIISLTVISVVLLSVALFVIYEIIPGMLGVGDLRGGDVNASAQFLNILRHPFKYLEILWNFLANTYLNYEASNGWTYNLRSMAYLGLAKLKFIPVMMLILVSITDKNQHDQWEEIKKVRLIMMALIIITICIIATGLYVDFTPYGSEQILGCQARYLIPVFLPFFILIGSSNVQNHINRRWYNGVVIYGSAMFLLINLWQLLVSQYY